MDASISGAIKCRKPFFGCLICGNKIEHGEIYTYFRGGAIKKEHKVHRSCAFRYIGATDPLLEEVNQKKQRKIISKMVKDEQITRLGIQGAKDARWLIEIEKYHKEMEKLDTREKEIQED